MPARLARVDPNRQAASFAGTAIPAWLTLDRSSGVLSGTLSELGDFKFVVSATNAYGVGYADVVVRVLPPKKVHYRDLPPKLLVEQPLAPRAPVIEGGAVESFHPDPLPWGVDVDPASGMLSGCPTGPWSGVAYVRVHWRDGHVTRSAPWSVAVVYGPPTVTYAPLELVRDEPIGAPVRPLVVGKVRAAAV